MEFWVTGLDGRVAGFGPLQGRVDALASLRHLSRNSADKTGQLVCRGDTQDGSWLRSNLNDERLHDSMKEEPVIE